MWITRKSPCAPREIHPHPCRGTVTTFPQLSAKYCGAKILHKLSFHIPQGVWKIKKRAGLRPAHFHLRILQQFLNALGNETALDMGAVGVIAIAFFQFPIHQKNGHHTAGIQSPAVAGAKFFTLHLTPPPRRSPWVQWSPGRKRWSGDCGRRSPCPDGYPRDRCCG